MKEYVKKSIEKLTPTAQQSKRMWNRLLETVSNMIKNEIKK